MKREVIKQLSELRGRMAVATTVKQCVNIMEAQGALLEVVCCEVLSIHPSNITTPEAEPETNQGGGE